MTNDDRPPSPPVANPKLVNTPEDTAVDIVLTGSDLDGGPLTFTVLSLPAAWDVHRR